MVPHAGMHLVGGVGAAVYGRYTGGRHHPEVQFEAAERFCIEAALLKAARVTGAIDAALAQRKMLFAAADFRHDALR